MSLAWHRTYLKITAFVIGSFGPIFFLGTMAGTREPARLTMDLLSWPIDGASTWSSPDTHFLSALTGGFLFGWGVCVALLTRAHDVAPEPVRQAVVGGVCAWFCLDSAGSIASGNPSNALINVAVLLIAVGPLWVPARPSLAERAAA